VTDTENNINVATERKLLHIKPPLRHNVVRRCTGCLDRGHFEGNAVPDAEKLLERTGMAIKC